MKLKEFIKELLVKADKCKMTDEEFDKFCKNYVLLNMFDVNDVFPDFFGKKS